jgi:hypothetical protein
VPTLYRRLLGEAFETLPPVLRRFHGLAGDKAARGVLSVTRGKGRLRSTLADLMRLPAHGARVGVRLRVVVEGERERWVREFDGILFQTVQWARAGLLIETAGPLRFGFQVVASPEGLSFEQKHGWLYGLPLPRALTPQIRAEATAGEASWTIDVRVAAPFVGLLARYYGEVTPE